MTFPGCDWPHKNELNTPRSEAARHLPHRTLFEAAERAGHSKTDLIHRKLAFSSVGTMIAGLNRAFGQVPQGQSRAGLGARRSAIALRTARNPLLLASSPLDNQQEKRILPPDAQEVH